MKMIHMPSGQEDFKQLRENKDIIYIDKTYFIKEWWESSYDKVSLILRPRSFGKTLNMSMLDYFFSNQYKDARYLFKDLFISGEESIMSHFGKYPVIFLSFSDLKSGNSESIKSQIKVKIWQVYLLFKKRMLESDNLDISEKSFIESITYQMNDDVAVHSIQYLCCFLNKVFVNKYSIVLLDEYDSIMTKMWNLDEWSEAWENIKDFFVNFISSTFKDNKFMLRGLITGVMNIPLSFNFSCTNNINVYNMTSNKYWNCFGFTIEDIQALMKVYHFESKIEMIENWYGGYKCGNVNIFNPCSIVKFFNQSQHFSIYWSNTSNNEFIRKILRDGSLNVKDCMIQLIQERSIQKELTENLVFNNYCYGNEESIWTLLVYSGYLTIKKQKNSSCSSTIIYTLKIPNEEVIEFFIALINEWFESRNYFMNNFINAFLNIDIPQMATFINLFVEESFAFFANSQIYPEIIYHAFILGLVTHIKKSFDVTLNNIDEDGCFYVVLKSLESEQIQKSFIFLFRKQNSSRTNLLKSIESAFNESFQNRLINDLEIEGFEKENIKIFAFAYNSKECLVSCKDQLSNANEEEKTDNNEYILDSLSIPSFDRNKRKYYFNKNDSVFVIDENGYDIYEGVIIAVKNNIYRVHYPDYPQDDEEIKGTKRILEKTKKNINIFQKQEEMRKRNEEKKKIEEEKEKLQNQNEAKEEKTEQKEENTEQTENTNP